MFTTFSSSTTSRPADDVKKKRSQVTRACDWCRLNRVKCDDHEPCRNCQARGSRCSNTRSDEIRTLPSANREITRLKAKIKDLESDLEKNKSDSSTSSSADSANKCALSQLQAFSKQRHQWRGVWLTNSPSSHAQYYGPCSSAMFTHRMRHYLRHTLNIAHADELFPPSSPSRMSFSGIASAAMSRRNSVVSTPNGSDVNGLGSDMSRQQEGYFLNLFWQSSHLVVPIINEAELRDHYNSLWANGTTSPYGFTRKASPLIDIMLALCLQYGTAFISRGEAGVDMTSDDASTAGRWLYLRSRELLSEEREAPTLSTVQCDIYASIYLRNASSPNKAHETLAVAVRTAHMLGLQHDPPSSTPAAEAALRRRIWWTLYHLDAKMCLELGRPFIIHAADMTCTLPSSTKDEPQTPGSPAPYDGVGWFDFHFRCVQLMVIVRGISTAFEDKCNDTVSANGGKDLYDDPDSLEACAQFLTTAMKPLGEWVKNLPAALKSTRQGTGEPFSTARSAIEVDPYVPIWLQRQRVLLELLYHNLLMCLYRPFIRFPPNTKSANTTSSAHSVACLNHAAVTTTIIHQMLTETDVLNLLLQAFQLQWDAAISLVGFTLAHPVCPHSPGARKAIQTAISIFNILGGNNLGSAMSAAVITRTLLDQTQMLTTNNGANSSSAPSHQNSPSVSVPRMSPSAMASSSPPFSNSSAVQTPHPQFTHSHSHSNSISLGGHSHSHSNSISHPSLSHSNSLSRVPSSHFGSYETLPQMALAHKLSSAAAASSASGSNSPLGMTLTQSASPHTMSTFPATTSTYSAPPVSAPSSEDHFGGGGGVGGLERYTSFDDASPFGTTGHFDDMPPWLIKGQSGSASASQSGGFGGEAFPEWLMDFEGAGLPDMMPEMDRGGQSLGMVYNA